MVLAVRLNCVGSVDGQVEFDPYVRDWLAGRRRAGLRCGRGYASVIRVHLSPRFARLSDITPQACRELFADLERFGEAPRTRLRVRQLLHKLCADAVEAGLMHRNPVPRLPGCDVDADPTWRSMARFSAEEIGRLIAHPEVRALRRCAWDLLSRLGLRVSELGGAAFAHIRRDMKPLPALIVVRSYNTLERNLQSTKTRQPRALPLTAEAMRVIDVLAEIYPRLTGRCATSEDPIIPVMFRGRLGLLRNDTANKWLHRDCETVGIRKRGVNCLRATYASMLRRAKVPETIISELMHNRPNSRRDVRVIAGYCRSEWSELCEANASIKIEALSAFQLRLPFS
jgi:integrase